VFNLTSICPSGDSISCSSRTCRSEPSESRTRSARLLVDSRGPFCLSGYQRLFQGPSWRLAHKGGVRKESSQGDRLSNRLEILGHGTPRLRDEDDGRRQAAQDVVYPHPNRLPNCCQSVGLEPVDTVGRLLSGTTFNADPRHYGTGSQSDYGAASNRLAGTRRGVGRGAVKAVYEGVLGVRGKCRLSCLDRRFRAGRQPLDGRCLKW